MNVSGLSIFDIYGVERIPLDGDYSMESLADLLVEQWIPYFECHKCGRWDYCKFAQKHPANPARSIDIRCGVAADCLRNLVRAAYPLIEKMDRRHRQSFLDGAFHFYGFVYSSEQWIGMNMNRDFHEWFGDLAPYLYSRVAPLRSHLDSLAFYWKDLPDFKTKSPVLFVEGYSEKAFLDELRKSHLSWFLDLVVEVYGGRGNRGSRRIHMLLERYKQQGFVVHAQGDADGKNADIFRNLVDAGLIAQQHTFVFEHDFESAIPLPLAYAALSELGSVDGVTKEEFVARLKDNNRRFADRLSENYGIDMEPIKMEYAVAVGDILNRSDWWNNGNFMEKTELGRFLRFVQHII
jgi:hypothetical protein